jgi:glycosyltransferase involved in cell wall biosynthesis
MTYTTKLIRITTVPVSLKELLKGQHRFMSENGYEVLGVSSEGNALHDVHENEGVRVVALEMTRTISLFKDLKALWGFYRLCIKEKPLMVHSHTPKAGIVGMLGAKLAGVPIRLHTVAGLPLMEAIGLKRKVLDIVEKLTYSCANMVYPNSKGLYDFILSNRFTNKEKLKVIANGSSNGIDTGYFNTKQISIKLKEKLKADLNISEKDFVFAFVGRLVKDKGINELVSAFSRLKDQNTKLILVGILEEELDPLLPETLKEINTNKNIISVGWQSDVRPYFAISDALVFPSYREGFPNVVMQAGAMGLPSIVTDINGCNEIIIDNENGIIIPPKDEKKLYEAMLSFLNDPQEVDRLANNSRKMIVDRYEQHVVWDALLKEYKRLEKELLKN